MVTILFQVETLPYFLRQEGFGRNEINIVVPIVSCFVVILTILELKFILFLKDKVRDFFRWLGWFNNISWFRSKNHLEKKKVSHRISHKLNTWGLLGLLVLGFIPWPFFLGAIIPITYLQYCEAGCKRWYIPNLGLLSIEIGVVVKMFLFFL